MACYFDEHNCKPLAPGQTPDHFLHFARLLLDSGLHETFDLEFGRIFAHDRPPPPASKKALQSLKTRHFEADSSDKKCAICLKLFAEAEEIKEIPCSHEFHSGCILPWLTKTNSCPVCRYELPTDDADYEEYKRQKTRAKQRASDLENLHDSMFG